MAKTKLLAMSIAPGQQELTDALRAKSADVVRNDGRDKIVYVVWCRGPGAYDVVQVLKPCAHKHNGGSDYFTTAWVFETRTLANMAFSLIASASKVSGWLVSVE